MTDEQQVVQAATEILSGVRKLWSLYDGFEPEQRVHHIYEICLTAIRDVQRAAIARAEMGEDRGGFLH